MMVFLNHRTILSTPMLMKESFLAVCDNYSVLIAFLPSNVKNNIVEVLVTQVRYLRKPT